MNRIHAYADPFFLPKHHKNNSRKEKGNWRENSGENCQKSVESWQAYDQVSSTQLFSRQKELKVLLVTGRAKNQT